MLRSLGLVALMMNGWTVAAAGDEDCAQALKTLTQEAAPKKKQGITLEVGHPVLLSNDTPAGLRQVLPDQSALVETRTGQILRVPVNEIAFGITATETVYIGAEVLSRDGQVGVIHGIYSNGRLLVRVNERKLSLFHQFEEVFWNIDELRAYSVQKFREIQWGDQREIPGLGSVKIKSLFSNGEFIAVDAEGKTHRGQWDSSF